MELAEAERTRIVEKSSMTREERSKIVTALSSILDRTKEVLTSEDRTQVTELIEAHEFGLALETIVYAVHEEGGRVPRGLVDEMSMLARQLEMENELRQRLIEITQPK